MKRIAIGIALLLALLLGAAIAIPYFFKDKIVAEIKKTANKELTAVIDFRDVNISLFRHFPKLSVGLEELSVTGTGPFEGVRLLHCPRLDVGLDFWAIVAGGNVRIERIDIEQPDVKVYVLADGRANYDITKPAPANAPAPDAKSSPIQLERYTIENGQILYDDRSLDMRAELAGLDHTGKGEFTADIYDLVMTTDAAKLSINYGGVQYLRNAHAHWDATVNADIPKMKFTLKNNDFSVNELKMNLDGWMQMPNDEDIVLDLKFDTPQNTFKSLLSIVPGAYTKDFADVKADGSLKFSGMVRGTYNEKTYPAFKLETVVSNGSVKYPSLPLGMSNIDVDMTVNSPTNRLNDMTVNIPKFNLNIGSNPIAGYFNLKTPETDPNIDTKIKGTLNMAELSKAFPMEGVQELSGVVDADVLLKAAMSQIERQQYEQVQVAGTASIRDLVYRSAGTPPVQINTLQTNFSPQKVTIDNFDGKLGRSDIRASGQIDNLLAWFSTAKTMTGRLDMNSGFFDANEWMEAEPAATTTAPTSKTPSEHQAAAAAKPFDRWDFTVNGRIGQLRYDTYTISNMLLDGHFTPNKMNIANFALNLGESDLQGSGTILNAWNYLFDNQTVGGTIALKSKFFDLNPFMTEAVPTAPPPVGQPAPVPAVIPVPENMDMQIEADFDKVRYTNIDLQNLNGTIEVKDRRAVLKDCTAGMLGGQVAVNGQYDTRDLSKPLFNVDLAVQELGFRDAWQTMGTMKTLAPVSQFMQGKFNTTLSMSGLLGKDMMPDFSTLNAAGFVQTLNAFIADFKGLSFISDKLNLDYLKKFDISNSKNWFEVKDGRLVVKPFNVQYKDVNFQIMGEHGLAKADMKYQIITKTPRKVLEKSAVTSTVNSGLNWLSGEASKNGVNIAQGEYINVRFDLNGPILGPAVTAKVLGSDGERTIKEEATAVVQNTVEKAKDSLRNVATRELDKAKDKVKSAADQVVDTLTKTANKQLEQVKDKAVEEVKTRAGEAIGDKVGEQVGQKAGEVLGEQGKKTVDEMKDKLDKWDPFKKKKKPEGGN